MCLNNNHCQSYNKWCIFWGWLESCGRKPYVAFGLSVYVVIDNNVTFIIAIWFFRCQCLVIQMFQTYQWIWADDPPASELSRVTSAEMMLLSLKSCDGSIQSETGLHWQFAFRADWCYSMPWLIHSPAATCCESQAEVDYRVNGMDWKGRPQFESRCGNVMNLRNDYRSGQHKGIYEETNKHAACDLKTNICEWHNHLDGCYVHASINGQNQTAYSNQTTHMCWIMWCWGTVWGHSCQSNTMGCSMLFYSWHWHMVLNVYL